MSTITYSHKRPPVRTGDGRFDCCPIITFPTDVPGTDPTPIDDAGYSIFSVPSGSAALPLTTRLHKVLAKQIAETIATSRGFTVTAADVQLLP